MEEYLSMMYIKSLNEPTTSKAKTEYILIATKLFIKGNYNTHMMFKVI